MVVQVLQNNLVPFSLGHAVRPLRSQSLRLISTFLRVLCLTLCARLRRGMTPNRMSVFFYLSFSNATSRSHCAANSFIESGKLILTYVCLHEDQLLHLVLNQSVEIPLSAGVDRVLVAELVNEQLGKMLALCLFLVVLRLRLGLGLLGVHFRQGSYYLFKS